jgi:prepilin-type N-terminal cleavage/methylation domain-containing protein
MNTHRPPSRGFTLIELLVVIAIMSLLAALLFPITGAINKARIGKKTAAELKMLEAAIENYKSKYGYYPPDNPGFPATNQLYYELLGCKATQSGNVMNYETLDGSARFTPGSGSAFGTRVAGIMNTTKPNSDDDAARAQKFLPGLKPAYVGELTTGERLIVASTSWPEDRGWRIDPAIAVKPGLNPFNYISSNPTNNPGHFDLWVDVVISGKTNRINNWSKRPIVVGEP